MQWWKNCRDRLIFGKVTAMSRVACFFLTHGVFLAFFMLFSCSYKQHSLAHFGAFSPAFWRILRCTLAHLSKSIWQHWLFTNYNRSQRECFQTRGSILKLSFKTLPQCFEPSFRTLPSVFKLGSKHWGSVLRGECFETTTPATVGLCCICEHRRRNVKQHYLRLSDLQSSN